MNSRDQGSLFASTLHRGPAPDAAQYSVVKYDSEYAPGGSSLMSRATRFEDAARKAPDPGAYEVRGTLGRRPERAGVHKPATRVTYTRRNNAAAIPSRTEVMGYEEDSRTGELRKAIPTETTAGDLGPGSHAIPDPASLKTPYGGVDFGARSSKRVLKTSITKAGPAPGAYNNTTGKALEVSNKAKRAPITVMGTSDRNILPKEATIPQPAPNTYLLPQTFGGHNPRASQLQNFGSTTSRFPRRQNRKGPVAPGPGAYEEPRKAIQVKTNGALPPKEREVRCPFGQSAARFAPSLKSKQTPGANSYDVESWQGGAAGVDIAVQASTNLAAKGGFGSTVLRPDPYSDAARKSIAPAPSAYRPRRGSKNPLKQKATSSFKSSQPQRPAATNLDTPKSTAYFVAQSHSALTETTAVARQADPSKPFLTQQSRFDHTSSTQREKLAVRSNPGPSNYDPLNSVSHTRAKGATVSQFDTAVRIKPTVVPNKVAPNQYTLGSQAESTYKPTFNVTLDQTK